MPSTTQAPWLSDYELYLPREGTHYRAHEKTSADRYHQACRVRRREINRYDILQFVESMKPKMKPAENHRQNL
jgi:hypothetical protein